VARLITWDVPGWKGSSNGFVGCGNAFHGVVITRFDNNILHLETNVSKVEKMWFFSEGSLKVCDLQNSSPLHRISFSQVSGNEKGTSRCIEFG
jgi:hypothetical protein